MRVKFSIFAALLMAATGLGFGGSVGGAEELLATDLSTSVVGEPATVSPVGGLVLYTVTFSNGPVPVAATLSDATSGGGTYVASLSDVKDCAAPADGTTNPVIACDRSLLPLEELVIKVAIRTPSVAGTVTNTSRAGIDPKELSVIDLNPANNTSEQKTPVLNDPLRSAALVKQGDSLAFRTHVATVTAAPNGIVIFLKDAFGGGDACGQTVCGDGLSLDFSTDEDRQGELTVALNFPTDPCRGVGAEKCIPKLYERKFVDGIKTIKLVPDCTTLPGNDRTTTCLVSVVKNGVYFTQTIRMHSVDPEILQAGALQIGG